MSTNNSVAIFIDGSNLYATVKSLGFTVDYNKLLNHFKLQYGNSLIRVYYFTAILDKTEYSPLKPLSDYLVYNGYTLITKQVKEFTTINEAGVSVTKIKGNMDIEIAVAMMEAISWLDHMILFSGDGDFRSLVEAVQWKGVKVTVISSLKTKPPMIADELRRQADSFIDLFDLQTMLEKK